MMTEKQTSLAHKLYSGDISYNFIGHRKIWYLISSLAVLASIIVLLTRGLSIGIEFRGGADFQTPVKSAGVTTDSLRSDIDSLKLPDMEATTVLKVGENNFRIQTRSLETSEVTKIRAVIAKAAGVPATEVAYSLIGPSSGAEFTERGIIALVVFIVLVMALIGLYFRNWKMSISAIVALTHDLIVTIGVYAAVGFTVTPATVIGVLTILGYSLYDTVVVFDKVRENVAELDTRQWTYSQAANLAVNQVLIRSLNTTLIGVLPVGALLIAGIIFLHNGPLVDLGLALFVGMIAGAYSSIFIAAPLLSDLKEREPAMVKHRARLDKRTSKAKSAAESLTDSIPNAVSANTVSVSATEGLSTRRQTNRNQSRSQRKKKR